MAGGVINTGSHPKLLWPGVHATWGQVYNEHEKEYLKLFDQLDSDKAYEQDVQVVGGALAPIKPEGQGGFYAGEVQGMISTYTHIAYMLGYIVTYEEMRDNLYEEVATNRAKGNAFNINQTIETVATFLYNNAFTTTYYTTGDGAALVSAAHVYTAGGTWSNALTPSADLSEAALEDVSVQAMGFLNDVGQHISIMPRSLIVPIQEWYNANRIMKSVLTSSSANNAVNVLKATNAFPEGIHMNHYLSAPHAWFVRTNAMHGMQMFWRDKPFFDQDNDFNTKNALAATYMRFSIGATDPRGIIGSNGP